MTWALDLDGVVWLAGRALPGAAEAVEALRRAGERVVFLTNTDSGPLVAGHVGLAAIGIACTAEDMATSAQAAASLLPEHSRAAVVGEEGIREALAARAIKEVGAADNPEAVIVGRTLLAGLRGAGRRRHRRAWRGQVYSHKCHQLPHRRSRRVASWCRGPRGICGHGSRPVARGGGQTSREAMAAMVKARFGELSIMVGDRPDTDGLFAKRVGARFGLVLSGVTRASDLPVDPTPDRVARDSGRPGRRLSPPRLSHRPTTGLAAGPCR